jgi:hypothetical protein
MANSEHLTILKQGPGIWNSWRQANPEVTPDLREAYLFGRDLSGADLRHAELEKAQFQQATLQNVNLRGASCYMANFFNADMAGADLQVSTLSGGHFGGANLTKANLSKAPLNNANLARANLSNASLVGTNLEFADLSNAILSGADLTTAKLWETNFAAADLSRAIGLEDCQHGGPSIIDHRTIQRSGRLPESFLKGCGLPDLLIKYIPSIFTGPIQFYSCFISYSHDNEMFAHNLFTQLQKRGVRCWLGVHQILPGDDIREQIDRAIRLWDKVLLCCSEISLNSYWVNSEIDKALSKEERLWKERGQKILALIPLNLDNYLFRWQNSRASVLTGRHAEDLVGWDQDPDKLARALIRVERALRLAAAQEPPPPSQL